MVTDFQIARIAIFAILAPMILICLPWTVRRGGFPPAVSQYPFLNPKQIRNRLNTPYLNNLCLLHQIQPNKNPIIFGYSTRQFFDFNVVQGLGITWGSYTLLAVSAGIVACQRSQNHVLSALAVECARFGN